jgi:hypothetical protein
MSKKAIVITEDEDVFEITVPIENYVSVFAWGLDMCRAMQRFGKFRKKLLKLVMGRYAYRELVGLRDCIEKLGYSTSLDYGLEGMDYHKDKAEL